MTTPLPPPTAEELAVIRARIEARRWPLRRLAVRDHRRLQEADDALRVSTGWGPSRDRVSRSEQVAVLGVAALGFGPLTVALSEVARRGTDALVAVPALLLAAVALVVLGTRTLRSPGVGGSAVLNAVDGALRRVDLGPPMSALFSVVLVHATAVLTPSRTGSTLVYGCIVVSALCLVPLAVRGVRDRPLLADPRLAEAV